MLSEGQDILEGRF